MQSHNRILDDLARVLNGAAGTLAGAAREGEASMRERAREWVGNGAEAVSRDEFEAVKAMAAAARDENELLRARLAALEAKLADVGLAGVGPAGIGSGSAGAA